MSVLSAQCDALRACAQSLRTIAGNPAWREASEMDKAADTIWRLREQNLELHDKVDEQGEQIDHLRELVRDMYRDFDGTMDFADYERRMHELGIEVDE